MQLLIQAKAWYHIRAYHGAKCLPLLPSAKSKGCSCSMSDLLSPTRVLLPLWSNFRYSCLPASVSCSAQQMAAVHPAGWWSQPVCLLVVSQHCLCCWVPSHVHPAAPVLLPEPGCQPQGNTEEGEESAGKGQGRCSTQAGGTWWCWGCAQVAAR